MAAALAATAPPVEEPDECSREVGEQSVDAQDVDEVAQLDVGIMLEVPRQRLVVAERVGVNDNMVGMHSRHDARLVHDATVGVFCHQQILVDADAVYQPCPVPQLTRRRPRHVDQFDETDTSEARSLTQTGRTERLQQTGVAWLCVAVPGERGRDQLL